MDVDLTIGQHRAANGDCGVERAVVTQVPDRPAVDPSTFALELRDQLHRTHFRRAAQGARREHRPQRVERIRPVTQLGLDVADQVLDVAEALDLHVAC